MLHAADLHRRAWLRRAAACGTGWVAGLGLGGTLGAAWGQTPAGAAAASAPPAARIAVKGFNHFRVGNKNVKRLLVEDRIVWVATSGGVLRYDTVRDDYTLFDAKSGLLSNGIFHIARIDGRLMLGTYGGGLAVRDEAGQRWRIYNIPEGLGDAFVYDLLKTRDGDLWIATWSGVNRVRGGRLDDRRAWSLHTVESTAGGLPNDWVYGLAEGPDGTVWLATEGGLSAFKDERWQRWTHAEGLGAPYDKVRGRISYGVDPAQVSQHHARQKQEMGLEHVREAYNPNYIVSLAVDAAGVVWAGTWGGGLSRFDGRGWQHLTVDEGLPGNHIFMLQHDRAGRLWIGTNNGLARMRPGGGFELLNTHDGLFSNAVFSMAEGPGGELWVGSFGGVARLRLAA